MAELAKKLQVKSSGTTTPCKIYSTSAEAGTSYVRAKVDNVEAYIPLVDASDGRASKVHIGSKCIATTGKPPYNKIEYKTPNTYTFTVPSGVTTLKVEVAGAGGGGGGSRRHSDAGATGGTGGTGELVIQTLTISSESTCFITVGAGGSGGNNGYSAAPSGNPGSAGGASSVKIGSTTIIGRGGGGGGVGTGNSMGAAGSPSYSGGGSGGTGGNYHHEYSSTSGANGWVIIEYGGDI